MNENHKWKLVKFGKYLVSVGMMTLVVGSGVVMASVSTNTDSSKQSTAKKVNWQANSTETVKQNIASQKKSNDLDNYEVQWGDTLGTISVATGISVNDLASRYGIPDANSIFAGVTLVHQKEFNSQVANITAVISSNRTAGTKVTTSTPAVTGTETTASGTPAVSGTETPASVPAVSGTTTTTSSTPVVSDTPTTASSTPAVAGSTTTQNTPAISSKNNTSTNNGSAASTDKGTTTPATSTDNSGVKHAEAGSPENPVDPDTGTQAPNGTYFDNDGWN
ncbi:hypothetical protein LGMK_00995 [Leuconostoc sp. C2]|nr:hypothetical protein LGMK_00995 [Leuconostoc sp. C2]